MMNGIAAGMVRLARTTALAVGASVMVALILGVASTALAGTGVGATFNLGKANSVNAVSKLVGNIAGSMLVVDNNGTGSALDLQVGSSTTAPADKTVAPMKVDSQAVVDNLNADELDGKSASDFYPAGSKVDGAVHADTTDSATSAQNANTLDGKDSSEFAPAGAFAATEVIDSMGSLPMERSFVSKGGTLLISFSGTAFRASGNTRGPGLIGMNLKIDGVVQESSTMYANERDSHKAFPSDYQVISGLPAGTHTIRLETIYEPNCNSDSERDFSTCTTTDRFDKFAASVVELPK